MKKHVIWRNAAIMFLFAVLGLTQYADNVRTVQVLGLFASGAVFGISLSMMRLALKSKQQTP